MIRTTRLDIKPWTVVDAGEFLELTQDEGFNLFPITIYRQTNLKMAEKWIQEMVELNVQTGLGKWAIWEQCSGELIGLAGLSPWKFELENLVDITYRLRESSWGNGYGLEAARALVNYGFGALNLTEITATMTPENLASKKIADKLGMKFDQHFILKGVPTDLYRLLRK